MSKEIKMEDCFVLPVSNGLVERLDFNQCESFVSDGVVEFDAIAHAINTHDRLAEENAALRETLRLKEAECEALADDKQQLMGDCALCVEELQAWADEFQESSADLLIEKVKASLSEVGGDNEKQQAD